MRQPNILRIIPGSAHLIPGSGARIPGSLRYGNFCQRLDFTNGFAAIRRSSRAKSTKFPVSTGKTGNAGDGPPTGGALGCPFSMLGVSRYADRNGLITGGNDNGTQRQSSDHRSDIGNPRALAYQAASLLSRLWRRQIAAEGVGPLSGAALPFRVAGTGELWDALRARLSFRRRAQDDRREHRRGRRPEGDPTARSRAA